MSDPFEKYPRKLKDVKKRDFLVKKLKKEREELHYQHQLKLQQEEDQPEVERVAPKCAQAIVIVKDSYLSRNLSGWNNARNKDNLPKKWSKHHQVEEEEDEDDGDEDDQDEDDDDDDGDDDDEDLEDEDDNVDETPRPSQKKKQQQLKLQNKKQYPTHEESSDDDEEELRFTQKRVVQFIEAFNEVEIIDNELDNAAASKQDDEQHDYDRAKTIAPRSMRDKSKSPRLTPKVGSTTPKTGGSTTPKQQPRQKRNDGAAADDKDGNNHGGDDDDGDDLDSLQLSKAHIPVHLPKPPTNNHHQQQHQNKQADKQLNLIQQMKDLDLESLLEKKTELSPLPHPQELDTGVWWKYILDHGASIKKDGTFVINIVNHFPPAKDHDIPEDYFHISAGRKSAPEKPLTAFGLFKQHKIAEDPTLVTKSTHSKKGASKHSASDAKLKSMYYALSDEDLLDYHVLALCEKIRYKTQRAEYIYAQSTLISHHLTKKERQH